MSNRHRKAHFKQKGRAAKPKQRSRAANRLENRVSGLGGLQDRATAVTQATGAWWCTTNPFLYGAESLRMSQIAYDLYYGDWGAHKIVSIPVDDMFREGIDFKFNGQDTDVDERLEDEWNRLDITTEYIRGKKLERLLGGSVAILGVEQDGTTSEDPLDPATIDKGALKFINVVGRNRISKVEWQQDPLQANYNKPIHYHIDGYKIHRSRLVVFDGNPVTTHPQRDFYAPTRQLDGFGVSVLSLLWNALNRSELGQQAAAHLIQMASVLVMLRKGLTDLKMNRQGNRALAEEQHMMETISMYKSYIVDGEEVDIKQIAASFGSVPELIDKYLQILSAGSDIPAERFLSESVGGLNNNGNSRLENYYNVVRAKQNNEVTPHIMRSILPILIPSTFGRGAYNVRDFKIEWPRLWNLSDTEKAQVDTLNTNNILNMANQLDWTDEQTYAELKRKDIIVNIPDIEEIRRNQLRRDLEREQAAFMGDSGAQEDERISVGGGLRLPSVSTEIRKPRLPSVQLS